jgi:H3 lysine-79-specific histone-lysine N-methyltransferase
VKASSTQIHGPPTTPSPLVAETEREVQVMPETERKLVLHSPASSEYVEYRWPLNRTETWDEAVEIVETIRWVCRDFPDLKLAVEKFVLNSFEPTSFESMKQLCERYNRAVANIKKLWSGRQPPPGIDAPPSIPLLRHIINQAYNRAVTKPEELNSYEPFSPEVSITLSPSNQDDLKCGAP